MTEIRNSTGLNDPVVFVLDLFTRHPSLHSDPAKAAEDMVRAHTAAAGLDTDEFKVEVWRLLHDLIGYSDAKGFFREQVFGPEQQGGPTVHKFASAIRKMCSDKGIDYAELYAAAGRARDGAFQALPQP